MEIIPHGRGVRLAGYIRVSKEEQARDGHSLAAQEAALRRYAEALGFELTVVLTDAGTSGRLSPERRRSLRAVMRLCEIGDANGILVWRTDRLTRSLYDWVHLLRWSRDNNYRIVSASESFDTSSVIGRAIVATLCTWAEFESESLGERVRLVQSYLKSQGRTLNGRPPYGWRIGEDKKLEPVPRDQEILRRMLWLHQSGKGACEIARRLGIHPRTGRRWSHGNIQSIIRAYRIRQRAPKPWCLLQ